MAAVAERYPTLARAVALPVEGEKRRKVLAAIAAFADEGYEPSLREIAERARLDGGWQKAEALVRRLATDGLLRVEWATVRKGRRVVRVRSRNHYELILDSAGGR